MDCPTCRNQLAPVFLGTTGLALNKCSQCSGHWLSNEHIQQVASACEGNATGLLNALDGSEVKENREEVAYRRCPACHEIMNRRRSQAESFIVDYCLADGLWLDKGELYTFIAKLGTIPPLPASSVPQDERDPVVRFWNEVRQGQANSAMVARVVGIVL